MSESTLSLTYDGMAAIVGVFFSYGATIGSYSATEAEQVAVAIRRGLRQFYYPPPLPNESVGHPWSFLHPYATLTSNAPYSTGTITVVSGVVTLAVGTFPAWAAQGLLSVNGTLYDVSTRDGNSQVTLFDTTLSVSAGASYTLYQGDITLPDSFGGFDDEPTFITPTVYDADLVVIDEQQIRSLRGGFGATSGRPQFVATRVVNATATAGQRYEALFHPVFDASYVMGYTYHILPDMISTTQYPLGGSYHAETILASCLYIAAQMLKDQEGIERKRADFMGRLASSVSHDRTSMTPERIMSDRELSEYNWRVPRRARALVATYQGF